MSLMLYRIRTRLPWRALRAALVTVCIFVAIAPTAWAHGGALADAVDAFESAPVYVDPDAKPTLTVAQHRALIDRIDETGEAIYVAVMDAQGDPAHDVVDELAHELGRDASYVVVAGGDFGVHSTTFAHERAEQIEAAANARSDAKLASTLDDVVSQVAAATPAEESGDTPWRSVGLALAAVAVLAATGTAWALRRARLTPHPDGD
jgi:hypothetical protein